MGKRASKHGVAYSGNESEQSSTPVDIHGNCTLFRFKPHPIQPKDQVLMCCQVTFSISFKVITYAPSFRGKLIYADCKYLLRVN